MRDAEGKVVARHMLEDEVMALKQALKSRATVPVANREDGELGPTARDLIVGKIV